jgi:hypothetical protein
MDCFCVVITIAGSVADAVDVGSKRCTEPSPITLSLLHNVDLVAMGCRGSVMHQSCAATNRPTPRRDGSATQANVAVSDTSVERAHTMRDSLVGNRALSSSLAGTQS